MTLFYFVVATFPLALYLLTISFLLGRSTPSVVDGRRDFWALSIALSGVFFVGPGQLMASWGASAVWGKYVWLLLAAFCFLILVLIGANLRPKLVVYNVNLDALRKALTTTTLLLDDEARWSGASMNMPGLGVQFFVDGSALGRVATLVRFGAERSQQGWKRLELELEAQLKQSSSDVKPRRWDAFVFGVLGVAALTADLVCVFLYYEQLRTAAAFYLSI